MLTVWGRKGRVNNFSKFAVKEPLYSLNPEWMAAIPNVKFLYVTWLNPASSIMPANSSWKQNLKSRVNDRSNKLLIITVGMFLYFLPFLLIGRRGLSLHPISIMKPAAVFFIFFQYTSNAQYIVAILISRCSCTKLCYCHINMKTTQDNSQMSVVHSDLSLSHGLKLDCVSKRC